MTTGSDKSQSAIIQHRLPEFVQTNHPTLVAFVQAYYEWLESQKESGYMRTPSALEGVSDIDATLDEFVTDFKKEFLLGFPEEFAVNGESDTVDVRKLIKNIKEFYRNKGTEKTYEFLFRVLYDTAVEFYYPARDILRLSDGKWIQKYSVRCSNDLGNKIFEARGKTITQRNKSTNSIVASGRVIDVVTYQIGNREISELFLTNINGAFVSNTKAGNEIYGGIEFTDNDSVQRTEPRIYPVLKSIQVTAAGTGYRKGERILFSASGDSGVGASATITEVDSMGGIVRTRIDNFGIGYENVPSYSIETAFGENASLTISVGSTCTYPGYYSGSDGKLSSSKVMQDNHYYQNFSYVLLSEVVIDRYKEILRRIIHPVGMGMFGKVLLTRCSAQSPQTDALGSKTEVPVIGNYAPYTIYTNTDLSELFYDDRPMPYYPSLHESVILAATGNPAGITNHHAVDFNPKNIPGLKVWLNGKQLTAAGATVSAWADFSGNGYTATALATNMLPSISPMGGLYLTGSSGTFGSVITTPALGTMNDRTMFVAFTPFPVSDSVTRQRNSMVAGLQRSAHVGNTGSATGQCYQNHTICIDYRRNNIDGIGDTQPRIASYYGFGNFASSSSQYGTDGDESGDYILMENDTVADRKILALNYGSVIYKELLDLESVTASNQNTTIACSVLADGYPTKSIQVYSSNDEVISTEKKSNNDLSPSASYYRYHLMAEYVVPVEGEGSYAFSMEQATDYSSAVAAWRSVMTKNDGLVVPTSETLDEVNNIIAEWTWATMTDQFLGSDNYTLHKTTAKDLKPGDVVRIWMSPSYNSGLKPLNSSLDITKSMKFKNFTVSRVFGQGENILTVDGQKIGSALGNLDGITAGQRLVLGLGQNYFNGVVHEVLVYDRALAPRERETVEAYLHYRWKDKIITATGHSWNLSVSGLTNGYGIYPALATNGGITANSTTGSSNIGYPFFEINMHPNISLAEQDTYAVRILSSQASDFLGGGTGSTGYWPEWAEGSTANRQNWAIGLSAQGSRHAILQYNTSSEFRKISADAFFDMKAGRQFDCKDEYVIEPEYPKVLLDYSDEFSNSSFEDPIYSNGNIIFHFNTENAENLEYWTTDMLEIVVNDGRGEYLYRPDNLTTKTISGFVSDGFDAKQYTVTVRLLDFYGKAIPGSENSVSFWFKYLNTAGAYDTLP
jgi:hypothetical protein